MENRNFKYSVDNKPISEHVEETNIYLPRLYYYCTNTFLCVPKADREHSVYKKKLVSEELISEELIKSFYCTIRYTI